MVILFPQVGIKLGHHIHQNRKHLQILARENF